MKKLIQVKNVVKTFDKQVVLKGISLDIYENEFVTLLGPSGCGKTTLLRIIAGFLEPSEGHVIMDGEDIAKVPAYKRDVNTVFQHYALFPHLNVYENIAFGLKIKKQPKDIIDQKVRRMISLVGLEGFEKRDVTKMSGGQQQRVAIARALVNEPKVLLLDESLSALDKNLRKEMQLELKQIQQEVGITFIFVTHDQEEALTMSDKIVIMKDGEIEQIGTPLEVYNEPINEYCARFIGDSNIIDGIMKKDKLVSFDDANYVCVDQGFKENETVDTDSSSRDVQNKMSDILGNHMITLVDVKSDNLIVVLDPTNPGIGIYQNGKIEMLNSVKGNELNFDTRKFTTFITSNGYKDGAESVIDFADSYQESKLSPEQIEENYGLDAQYQAL